MRIENFGLPGSGKSTISSAVRSRLADEGLVVPDPPALDALDAANPPGHQRIWREDKERQSFHTANYLKTHSAFHLICNTLYSQKTRNLGLLLSVGADMSRHQMNAARLHSFWVDEGFLHLGAHALMVASNWDVARCARSIEHFMSAIPRPDAVLLVRTSVEVATDGIFRRMSGKSLAQAERRFRKAFGGGRGMTERAALIDQMTVYLRSMHIPIIEVQGHTDVDALATKITAEVKRLQEGWPSRPEVKPNSSI